MEIKEFEGLLSPILGDKKIVSYTTKNLVGPGENYGSVMLAVDVKLEQEDLHLVAKMCPPTEFIKKMFNIPVTFKKEVYFYSKILPILQEFQRERGCEEIMDFVPKYYGSRVSLDAKSNEVDDDACLLLENVKVSGFNTCDGPTGFDLQTAEFLLKQLAMFHAVPIAFKTVHPERFRKEILPLIERHVDADSISKEMEDDLIETILEVAKKHEECAKYLDKIKSRLEYNNRYFSDKTIEDNELFSTMTHADFWVNNTMLKYDNGKPIANAMVDFQLVTYANLAHDLVFFIYTSLSTSLIDEHYDNLINLYYKSFISQLKTLGIDTTPYTYKILLEEIDNAARDMQLMHVLFMTRVIFTDKKKAKNLSDINDNELFDSESLLDNYYPKMWHSILDFAKRNWL